MRQMPDEVIKAETDAEILDALQGVKLMQTELRDGRAIGFMVGPDLPQVSPEQVGVLKLLKIAVEYNRFRERLKQEGRTEYNLGELADKVIIPILKL